nr:d-serine dehydratase [Quercus suber]
MDPSSAFFNPNASEAALKLQFCGKRIEDITPPAVILDVAVIQRNCRLMLDTAERLDVGFRSLDHPPWTTKRHAEKFQIVYGLPVSRSAIPRLAALARALGANCVGVFVDHPSHIKELDVVDELSWPGQIPVFVNIDVGCKHPTKTISAHVVPKLDLIRNASDHREGVAADSQQLADIASSLAASKRVRLAGLYTHLGSSYSVSNPQEALRALSQELVGLEAGALEFLRRSGAHSYGNEKIVLSLGATPTATAAQNLFEASEEAKHYRATLDRINQSFAVELHAGVYPVMDMQQLATRARPAQSQANPAESLLSFADLGMRTLVEVASVYSDRGEKPEALLAAGSIVLGREPCKSYPGWGVVTPWPQSSNVHYDPEGSKTGWIVGRISQEHGILTWEGPTDDTRQLSVGEKLLVWPNHACMAGVGFGWYLVVDSDQSDGQTIIDVWQPCDAIVVTSSSLQRNLNDAGEGLTDISVELRLRQVASECHESAGSIECERPERDSTDSGWPEIRVPGWRNIRDVGDSPGSLGGRRVVTTDHQIDD